VTLPGDLLFFSGSLNRLKVNVNVPAKLQSLEIPPNSMVRGRDGAETHLLTRSPFFPPLLFEVCVFFK